MKNKFLIFSFVLGLLAVGLEQDVKAQSKGPQYSFDNLPVVEAPVFKKDTFNITDYNVKPDGITLNTKGINAAIAACSAKGGGVVVIPRGLWLTGPIELKSNVNLHLKRDAVLVFTKDFDQYPLVETNWEGLAAVRNQSPIWAVNQQNIAITGHGIIEGNGDAWRMVKKDKLSDNQWKKLVASGGVLDENKKIWYPTEKSLKGSTVKLAGVIQTGKTMKDHEEIKDFLRPNLMVLTKCKNILLEGVIFQNSPAWGLHPLMSENITVRNITVRNPWYAQNGDGIDIESCKNVLIENSVFDVGDDGICIKSGRDEQGRKRAMPTENVIVRNSVVYAAHGGFVIGSEMSGGARNLFVYNCSFIGTDIGLRFKTTRGRGGVVENIHIKNINMKDIIGEAILFDMYYAAVDPVPLAGEKRAAPKVELLPVTEATPQFKDFYISNVVSNGSEKAIFVRGLPEMSIKNINLNNLTMVADKGIEITEGENINLNNVHVRVENKENPMISINNSRNVSFNKMDVHGEAPVLFKVEGEKTANVKVSNTDTSKAKTKVELGVGVKKQAFQIK